MIIDRQYIKLFAGQLIYMSLLIFVHILKCYYTTSSITAPALTKTNGRKSYKCLYMYVEIYLIEKPCSRTKSIRYCIECCAGAKTVKKS